MIVFLGVGGRLGNQIFQTAFVEGVRWRGERVFTTHMNECKKLFLGLRRYYNSQSYLLGKIGDRILHPFFQFLVESKVIGGFIENDHYARVTNGVLPIRYCRGYFQEENIVKSSGISRSRIRKKYVLAARALLREAGSRIPLFIHVRRGDHGVPGIQGKYNPLLPVDYYRLCIHRLARDVENPHFFFVGDDPEWCAREFAGLANKTICSRTAQDDMTLMTLCAGGVVSNSTFAWWGAYLCGKTAPIYAPRYWLGWSMREWHPRAIKSDIFRFVDVPEASGDPVLQRT